MARLQPERLGARDLERELTFGQWNARACRLANGLLGLGLRPGDRVAAAGLQPCGMGGDLCGGGQGGLIAVPVNFRLVGPEVRSICANCGVSAVIAEASLVMSSTGSGRASRP